MVATMSPAQAQLDESISTCRFAQRVAMVANSVSLNEELDPTLMIRRLKAEVKSLREEVRVLRGEEEVRSSLTADEVDRVRRACEARLPAGVSRLALLPPRAGAPRAPRSCPMNGN